MKAELITKRVIRLSEWTGFRHYSNEQQIFFVCFVCFCAWSLSSDEHEYLPSNLAEICLYSCVVSYQKTFLCSKMKKERYEHAVAGSFSYYCCFKFNRVVSSSHRLCYHHGKLSALSSKVIFSFCVHFCCNVFNSFNLDSYLWQKYCSGVKNK